jgi:hypothetical protein
MSKKRTYYVATFTAFIEADSEDVAMETADGAADAIEDYIGSHASGDPMIYRTKAVGVVLHDGPNPFADEDYEDDEEEYDVGRVRGVAHEAARLARLEPQRPIGEIVGQLVDKQERPTHCEHGVPLDEEPQCARCAAKIRDYLSGMVKRPTP